jgi:hypothetical protein
MVLRQNKMKISSLSAYSIEPSEAIKINIIWYKQGKVLV